MNTLVTVLGSNKVMTLLLIGAGLIAYGLHKNYSLELDNPRLGSFRFKPTR